MIPRTRRVRRRTVSVWCNRNERLELGMRARHSTECPSGGRPRPLYSAAARLALALLVAAALGCNSDSGGGGATRQFARADHARGGTFRNLGKRSAFDYGMAEPDGTPSTESGTKR